MRLVCDDPRGAKYLGRLLRTQPPAGRPYLEAAACLASRAHEGETGDDDAPYLLHALRVALCLVEEAGLSDPAMLAAALLHDAQEHQRRLTWTEVAAVAGAKAAHWARRLAIEHRRNPGVSKTIGIARYLDDLSQGPDALKLIKMADRLDNLRETERLGQKKKQRTRLLQERRDYAPLFAPVPGRPAQALRTRLGYFLEQARLDELPA